MAVPLFLILVQFNHPFCYYDWLIQRENDLLKQQISALTGQIQWYMRHVQSQHTNQSDFWQVPRNEVTLNMQKFLGTGVWGFVVEGKFRGQKVAVKGLSCRMVEQLGRMDSGIGTMAYMLGSGMLKTLYLTEVGIVNTAAMYSLASWEVGGEARGQLQIRAWLSPLVKYIYLCPSA